MSKFDMIVQLMVKNGVTTKFSENLYKNLVNDEPIIELDFSEHDKVFEDKIAEQKNEISMLKALIDNYRDAESELFGENKELKQRIAELESKETSDLPFDPLECANYLINATYERETSSLERGFKGLPEIVDSDRYTVDDLEQIAEHLLVYCKHNKESE